jgi:hypothetical protein
MLSAIAFLAALAAQPGYEEETFEEPEAPPMDEEAAEPEEPLQTPADNDLGFQAIMDKNRAAEAVIQAAPAQIAIQVPFEPKVVVPLEAYGALRDDLAKRREVDARREAPAVVLGSSSYEGEAKGAALALTLTLDLTLGAPGRWKTVPLVGDGVVLVSATRGKEALPISRESGYHVWVTNEVGEARLTIQLLVPARGPRGSIEFDFLAARTPITRFSCHFPVVGLEPRIDAAVSREVRSDRQGTVLSATLRPTTRVHLVGFRDLGEGENAKAKVYAESFNLLSVDEGSLDLFAVVRYTILYGGAKDFQVRVPPGMSVVSADGEGAFRYTVEKSDRGSIVKGETAFPMRNAYEISLRLRRESAKTGAEDRFVAPLVRCIGVEREHGWLAVEVPGKLKLEEAAHDQIFAVDVRQLPPEMIDSAVSPILKAYRYHGDKASVELRASRLPEKDPASASIDRLRAYSVVSPEGKVLTDLRITLRNRLRHTLVLAMPHGTRVVSTLLDGQPVKPSKGERGDLMLPLRRSSGDERLEPFTVQVVLENDQRPMGWLGRRSLLLPAVDLPVSSLHWSVYLPAPNRYSALAGELAPQVLAGEGSWHQPSRRSARGTPGLAPHARGEEDSSSANTGAMPVRIDLPESGVRLEHTRYWIEANEPVRVSYRFLRAWLFAPLSLLALLMTAGLAALGIVRRRTASGVFGAAGTLAALAATAAFAGVAVAVFGILLGAAIAAARRGFFARAMEAAARWWHELPSAWRSREKPEKRAFGWLVWRLLVSVPVVVFLVLVAGASLRILGLLTNPFAG